MNRALLVSAVLLMLAPAAARAGGVNFSWSTVCYTEDPVNSITFACDSNTAPSSWPMTMSFMVDTEMADFVGVEITVGVAWAPCSVIPLPDWWAIGATGCRSNSVRFSSDKTAVGDETCVEWTNGTAFDLLSVDSYNRALVKILTGEAIDASTPYDLQPGVEYYAGTLQLMNNKSAGPGACLGCDLGVGLSLSITAAGLDGRRDDLYDTLAGGNQCLEWNHPLSPPCGLCAPARNTTWGAVKSLYR